MSDPYLGEIRMFGGNFAPVGWTFCDGRLLNIADNSALYNLIGTTYGGDGQTTFALPDLRGRLAIHLSNIYSLGSMGGSETVTLTAAQLPVHSHMAQAAGAAGSQAGPGNGLWANSALQQFNTTAGNQSMDATAIAPAGGSLPHDNLMPFTVVSFIIARQGLYPSQ